MTLQIQLNKSAPSRQDKTGLFARFRGAFLSRPRQDNIPLWKLSEHQLRDIGVSETDAEIARLRQANFPLGHFGIAGLIPRARFPAD